jgi:hypothetical protein
VFVVNLSALTVSSSSESSTTAALTNLRQHCYLEHVKDDRGSHVSSLYSEAVAISRSLSQVIRMHFLSSESP